MKVHSDKESRYVVWTSLNSYFHDGRGVSRLTVLLGSTAALARFIKDLESVASGQIPF